MDANKFYYAIAACLIAAAALTAYAADTNYMDIQWNSTAKASVRQVWGGDINVDGFKEVVATSSETDLKGNEVGWVYLFDRDGNCIWNDLDGNPKCFKEVPGAISVLTVEDLNGDGNKEIIAGVRSSVRFFNQTGEGVKMYLPDSTLRVKSIIVDDIDADNEKELIVGSASTDTGKVFAYNGEKNRKWYAEKKGSITSVFVADLDGDGQKEVIVGATAKEFEYGFRGYVYVLNSKGDELWNYQTDKGVQTVYADDVDGDGLKEVLVGAQEKFYSLSSKGVLKGSIVTGTETGLQIPIRNILVEDINMDGSKEIILGANDVYALNKDYSKKWVSKAGTETYDLKYADLNNDGIKDIIAACEKLFFIGLDGNEIGTFALDNPRFSLTSLFMVDLNDDGFQEIVAGCADKNVYVLKSKISEKKFGADKLYAKAGNLKVAGNYTEARKNAESAKQIYEDLGSFTGAKDRIKEINDLLKSISEAENTTAKEKTAADEYYAKAQDAFVKGDYISAYTNAQIAKSKYQSSSLSDPGNVNRCNLIITPSTEALRSDAENALQNATELYAAEDYANASVAISRALKEYETIKDAGGMERAGALAERISEKTGGPTPAPQENKTDYLQQITGAFAGLSQGSDVITPALYILSAAALAVLAYLLLKRILKKKSKWEMGNRREQIGKRRAIHVAENVMDEMEKNDNEEPTLKDRSKAAHKEIRLVPEPVLEKKTEKEHNINLHHHKASEKHAEPAREKPRPKDVSDRKIIPKVTKDSFRAEGVSLRSMSCTDSGVDQQD